MDLQRPFSVITATLDGDILAVLARADKAFTGREIERHIDGASVSGVWSALQRLQGVGIILSERAGRANLYRLNREHLAAPLIEALASLRLQLLARLRETIEAWERPPHVAVLFGSAARGEAGTESDLDILIVRPGGVDPDDDRWREQLADLEARATAWTGNDTRILEYGQEELPGLVGQEPVLQDAVADGILLFGSMTSLKPRRKAAR